MTSDPMDAYHYIIRTSFMTFVHWSFLQLHPNVPFKWNWHLEVICAKLMDVMMGKIKRLVITVPPRSLKSHIASITFPAFVLGHFPHKRLFCASYAQTLGEGFARECLQLMLHKRFQSVFDARVAREAVADFTTTGGGGRFTTSVGGVSTGAGGDILIIDDPLKANEAMSDACRKSANDWMDTACFSRLNDKVNGAVIIIAQRLHEDDLIGHVLAQEDWEVVSFPAIAIEDETHFIDTPFGPQRYVRKKGEALHPALEPLTSLEATRKRMGSAAFSAQYQQDPAPAEGLFVKPHWFPRYSPATQPKSFNRIVVSWDTAVKITDVSDFSVGTVWGTVGDSWSPAGETIYLLQVVRGKWEAPELEAKVIEVANRYRPLGPVVTLIEDCVSGSSLIQRLSRLGHNVKGCKPEGDKKMRLYGLLGHMERGMIHLPQQAPELDTYLDELKAFPGSLHDDQVDSTSQALTWIINTPAEPNFLAYIRMAAKQEQEPDPDLLFKWPPGHTHFYLASGELLTPAADRILKVKDKLARILRKAGWEEITRR